MGQSLTDILAIVHKDIASHRGRGRVADYIPALARVDPRHFGIALVTCDGQQAAAGDYALPFSIQSVSKLFTLALAQEKHGGKLWKRVGHEPSGSSFNSIVQLEQEKGIPRNPLINAGALVVTVALLEGGAPHTLIASITSFMQKLAGDASISVDPEVAASEGETGFRNASLANFLRAYGNLHSAVPDVLQVYFNQCALRMNCQQL